ncbi:MAG: hypothetical protein KKB02_00975 [Alphaproteobacteria bacterium]|nr:hypothetical protein [Alphaproteobacteria bacterium]
MSRVMLTHHAILRLTLVLLLQPFQAAAQDDVFPLDQLNVGLTNPGPQVDRDTPQAAMESFIDLTDAGDLDAAAHLLDLNDIPVQAQAQRVRCWPVSWPP